jgi:hypothetical protein
MLRTTALVLLLSPLLAGCGQSETPLPETSVILDKLPVVENSTKSPCWQQRQIAAQRSYIQTVKAKRELVYAAPCDVDNPKRSAPAKVASASNG